MVSKKTGPASHLTYALIGLAVLYYALRLSAGDRGVVDYVVVGIVAATIACNAFQLARRMHAAAGTPGLLHALRVVALWALGLLYTVWGQPEYDGTWRQWLGWAFIAGAVVESVRLHWKARGLKAP
jgi:hypothetical protein